MTVVRAEKRITCFLSGMVEVGDVGDAQIIEPEIVGDVMVLPAQSRIETVDLESKIGHRFLNIFQSSHYIVWSEGYSS